MSTIAYQAALLRKVERRFDRVRKLSAYDGPSKAYYEGQLDALSDVILMLDQDR